MSHIPRSRWKKLSILLSCTILTSQIVHLQSFAKPVDTAPISSALTQPVSAPVEQPVETPKETPVEKLKEKSMPKGFLRGSYLFEDEARIAQLLEQKESPLLNYKGKWKFGDQVTEISGSEVIAIMYNLPLPNPRNTKIKGGGYDPIRVQGNPEIFLTYLQWRWNLLDAQKLTSEQIDEMVQISKDAEPILSEQLKWLSLHIHDKYVATMGKHLGELDYDDQEESRQVLSEILAESSSDPDALSDFMLVYYQFSFPVPQLTLALDANWYPAFIKPINSTAYPVTAVFDHDTIENDMITRMDTVQLSEPQNIQCTFGFNCYDDHDGTDYAAPLDTDVHAVMDGTVDSVRYDNTGGDQVGRYVTICHPSSADCQYKSSYWHLNEVSTNPRSNDSENRWAKDDVIYQNEVVGKVGNSHGTSGVDISPHLHLSVTQGSTKIDAYGDFGSNGYQPVFASSTNVGEQDSGFDKFLLTSWFISTAGQGNHSYYTYTDHYADGQYRNMALWWADIPSAGSYEVKAFIPTGATAQSVEYKILHKNGVSTVTKNQSANTNQWISLGTYEYDAHGKAVVLLHDYVGSSSQAGQTVYFDSIKWESSSSCMPTSDPWYVDTSCEFTGSTTAPGDVFVRNGATLTIMNGGNLNINFDNSKKMVIQNGSKLIVKDGGKIY